jgi:hypothetical protein
MDQNNSIERLRNTLRVNGTETSLRRRIEDRITEQNNKKLKVLLLDVSSSMNWTGQSGKSRIETLWDIVQQLRAENLEFVICQFSDRPKWIDLISQPKADGGTRLDLALNFVKDNVNNLHSVTLISDGEPAMPSMCLELAPTLRVPINVLFVGESNDSHAASFARELASSTGGQFAESDIAASEMLALQASTQARLMLVDDTRKNNAIAL